MTRVYTARGGNDGFGGWSPEPDEHGYAGSPYALTHRVRIPAGRTVTSARLVVRPTATSPESATVLALGPITTTQNAAGKLLDNGDESGEAEHKFTLTTAQSRACLGAMAFAVLYTYDNNVEVVALAGALTMHPHAALPSPTPYPASLIVTPATADLIDGATQQLAWTLVDQLGDPYAGTPSFVSDTPSVATVDAAGLVTTQGPGSATITASFTAEGHTVTDTSAIAVSPSGGATSVDLVTNEPVLDIADTAGYRDFLATARAAGGAATTNGTVEVVISDPAVLAATVQPGAGTGEWAIRVTRVGNGSATVRARIVEAPAVQSAPQSVTCYPATNSIGVGHSLMSDNDVMFGADGPCDWATFAKSVLPAAHGFDITGTANALIGTLVANAAVHKAMLVPTALNILYVWIGEQEFLNGLVWTDIQAAVDTYLTSMRGNGTTGFQRIVICLGGPIGTTQNVQVIARNDYYRTGAGRALIDDVMGMDDAGTWRSLENDPAMGMGAVTGDGRKPKKDLSIEGIHHENGGQALVAGYALGPWQRLSGRRLALPTSARLVGGAATLTLEAGGYTSISAEALLAGNPVAGVGGLANVAIGLTEATAQSELVGEFLQVGGTVLYCDHPVDLAANQRHIPNQTVVYTKAAGASQLTLRWVSNAPWTASVNIPVTVNAYTPVAGQRQLPWEVQRIKHLNNDAWTIAGGGSIEVRGIYDRELSPQVLAGGRVTQYGDARGSSFGTTLDSFGAGMLVNAQGRHVFDATAGDLRSNGWGFHASLRPDKGTWWFTGRSRAANSGVARNIFEMDGSGGGAVQIETHQANYTLKATGTPASIGTGVARGTTVTMHLSKVAGAGGVYSCDAASTAVGEGPVSDAIGLVRLGQDGLNGEFDCLLVWEGTPPFFLSNALAMLGYRHQYVRPATP